MARLSVSAQFTLKDRDKDPLSMGNFRGAHFNFAKDEAVPLQQMLWSMSKTIIECYMNFTGAEEMNEEIQKFADLVKSVKIEIKEQ